MPSIIRNMWKLSTRVLVSELHRLEAEREFELSPACDIRRFSLDDLDYFDYCIPRLRNEIKRRNELGII